MAHFAFKDPSQPPRMPPWTRLEAALIIGMQRLLPLTWSFRIAAGISRYKLLRNYKRCRRTEALLRRYFPSDISPKDLARQAAISRSIARIGARGYGPICHRSREWLLATLRPEGLEHLDALKRAGRGAIILSSHSGLNGWVGPSLRQLGYPMRLMQRQRITAEALFLLQWENAVSAVLPYPDNPESGIHLKRLHDLIKAGVFVPHAGDYADYPNGVEGQYLGLPVRCCRAPWVLARLTGAPCLPAFVLMDRDFTFRLIIGPPICVPRDGAPPQLAMQKAMQTYLDYVSARVLEMPWNIRPTPHTDRR